jgi:hypothetical protein
MVLKAKYHYKVLHLLLLNINHLMVKPSNLGIFKTFEAAVFIVIEKGWGKNVLF